MVQVCNRAFDECRLTKQQRVKLDVLWQRVLHLVQRLLNGRRHCQGVEIRLFVNDQQHAGIAVDCRAPNFVGGRHLNVGDVSQSETDSVTNRDGYCCQIGRRFNPRTLADRQSLVFGFHKASTAETSGLLSRYDDLIQGDAVLLQSKW